MKVCISGVLVDADVTCGEELVRYKNNLTHFTIRYFLLYYIYSLEVYACKLRQLQ